MSAYLQLFKIPNGIVKAGTFCDNELPDDIFDCGKYTGDYEFISNIEWDYLPDDDPEIVYRRPKDIDKAILWVQNNIEYESNQKRLISALNMMKTDLDVYFCFV